MGKAKKGKKNIAAEDGWVPLAYVIGYRLLKKLWLVCLIAMCYSDSDGETTNIEGVKPLKVKGKKWVYFLGYLFIPIVQRD